MRNGSMRGTQRLASILKLKTIGYIMFSVYNLLTRAKEPSPAVCGKSDLSRFYYAELMLIKNCRVLFTIPLFLDKRLNCIFILN